MLYRFKIKVELNFLKKIPGRPLKFGLQVQSPSPIADVRQPPGADVIPGCTLLFRIACAPYFVAVTYNVITFCLILDPLP